MRQNLAMWYCLFGDLESVTSTSGGGVGCTYDHIIHGSMHHLDSFSSHGITKCVQLLSALMMPLHDFGVSIASCGQKRELRSMSSE